MYAPPSLAEAPPEVLARLFDALPPFVSVVGPDLRYRWVNRRHQEWFGLPRESLVGRSVQEVVGPETFARLEPRLQAVLRGVPQSFDLELKGADGSLLWLQFNYIPSDSGSFYALATDRSEERRREMVLRENEERYRTLVDNVPGAVYRCAADERWTVDTISDAIEEIAGWPAAEFEAAGGRSLASIHHPEDAEGIGRMVQQAIRRGRAYELEYRILHRDGSVRWVYDKGRARRRPDGSGDYLEGVVVDISERKRAELALDVRHRELSVLHRVSQIALRSASLAEALQRTADALSTASGFPLVAIELYDAERETMRFAAGCGIERGDGCGPTGLPLEQAFSGEAVRSRRTLVDNDAQASPRGADPVLRRLGVQTFICAPMLAGERMIGALSLAHRARLPVDEVLPRWIESVANHLALEVERRRTEDALKESEARQRALVDGIPDLIFLMSRDGVYLDCHAGDPTALAVPPEAFLGRRVLDVMPPDLGEALCRAIEETCRSGGMQSLEYTLPIGGEPRHFDCRFVPMGADRVLAIARDITVSRRAEEAVRQVAEAVSARTGEAFFRELVRHLGRTLGADYVLAGELGDDGTRMRTLGFYAGGRPVDNTEYALEGTPCAEVVSKGSCICLRDVQALYPLDPAMVEMGAEAYVGTPLNDSAGRPLGLVAALWKRPLASGEFAESLLRIFAARAGAELERVRTEQALRGSEARLRWVTDAVPGVLYQWLQEGPREGRFIYMSARAEEIVGHKPGEMLDTPGILSKSVLEEDLDPFRQSLERAWRDLSPWRHEFRVRLPDGQVRWLRGSALAESRTEDGSVVWSGFLLDVTEAKHAEDELRLAAQVFETAAEGIIITDAYERIISVNRAFTQITGYRPEDALGHTPRLLRSDVHDGEFYRSMWDSIRGSGRWQGEIINRRVDGSVFPEWLSISAVRNRSGEVSHYVGMFSDITPIKESQRRLEELANFDGLTGLPNRNLLNDRLSHGLDKARRHRLRLAVMFIDLDNFKIVNDTLGHDAGDRLLVRVAQRLAGTVREQDTVARLGGDEFVVVLEELTEPQQATRMAERISEAFAGAFDLGGHEHFVTFSMGISLYPDDGRDVQGLLKNADLAMYMAKEQGRNCFRFFAEGMNVQAFERLFIEASLRRSLERSEFELHFQPVVDIGSGCMLSAEALVRWKHPDLGLLPPGRFVPVAEQSGLVVSLGEWILRAACVQAMQWADYCRKGFRVAINISARQFREQGLRRVLRQVLQDTGARPEWLELELTESAVMQDPEEAAATLKELRALGVHLSIDDFGTGYSSLAYLKRFPIDSLKIDRAFVRDVGSDPDDAAIVTAIITMAHSLGIRVVAEGVESAEQLAFLRERGCDRGQGYLFGLPLPGPEFDEALRECATPLRPS